ncbi:MAG TPA: DUF354 domain-containing protein [Desulfobacterales bacterium]|nr:DUF354 domain-containing protein [Desulfobacterales bacterium]
MRILIDIGHPAHVHLFKNFAWEMQKKKHSILFSTREKEISTYLLKKYGFDFNSFGKPFKGIVGKIFGMILFDIKLFLVSLKFKPDIYLSHGSIYAAHVSWILGKPHIAFEDTGNMEQIRLYLPFTKVVLTSYSFSKDFGYKQIRYIGFHDSAYLHPKRFNPDPEIFHFLGIQPNQKYAIVRFVSWQATHDLNQKGFLEEQKLELILELKKHAFVFITSEIPETGELKKYEIQIPPEKIHDALYYAALSIGEGATIASECASLGTPAIYVSSITAMKLKEQTKLGLVYCYKNFLEAKKKAIEIVKNNSIRSEIEEKRKALPESQIDLTAFLVWFIENYPKSFQIMKKDPDFQMQFK